jgi:hypothetical protein
LEISEIDLFPEMLEMLRRLGAIQRLAVVTVQSRMSPGQKTGKFFFSLMMGLSVTVIY